MYEGINHKLQIPQVSHDPINNPCYFRKDPRMYNILSKPFVSDGNSHVSSSVTCRWSMKEVEGSEQSDLIF